MEAFRAHALDVGSVADIPPIFADLDRPRRQDRRRQVPPGPDRPPDLPARRRPRRRREDPGRPAGQEDRLQPGPGAGRARAAGAEEGRPDQGRRQAGRDPQRRGRLQQRARPRTRSTWHRSAVSTSSATWPSTARTAATVIPHGLRDDPSFLYAPDQRARGPGEGGRDPRVRRSTGPCAQDWIDTHPDEWLKGYYEENQGLTATDGEWLVETPAPGHPDAAGRRDRRAPGDHRPARRRRRASPSSTAKDL